MTDLPAAIEAAARAHFAIQNARTGVTWEQASKMDQHAFLSFVTPLVTAAIKAAQ